MDDSSWDDGCVIPVACAAVILACVVTLSGFTRHAPYKTDMVQYGQTMKLKKYVIKYAVFRYVEENKDFLKVSS